MKNICFLLFTFFVCFSAISQTSKTIIVTEAPKTVPTGKKWILEAGKTIRVQLNSNVLNSGSLCNALFLSTPQMIANINHGNIYDSEGYILLFKDSEKVPYTNDYTYDLKIISIVDKDFSLYDLQTKSAEEVGVKNLEFKAGESVFVGNCLVSIELKETNISQSELKESNYNLDDINNSKSQKISSINIPVNPEKYVEPGTIPIFHDSNLKSIVFTSESVLHKSPGLGYALDDVSTWSLNLSTEYFTIKSSNGIFKSYTVIKTEFDEQMGMQKFILGDSKKEITHNVLISWSDRSNHYSLIFNSIDNSEQFQFQEVQAKEKNN